MNQAENTESENQAPEEEIEESISPGLDQFLEEQEAEEEGEESSDLDDLMNDWDEDDESDLEELGLDEIEEDENNPLEEYEGEPSSDIEEPSTEKVEHIKERVSSEKNSKNLERLGAKFLDKADLFKANLCSQLGGQHMAEYVADDEMKEILIECIEEYLATKEVSELTPFGALMAALAMWTLPPLGIALMDRFQLKKEAKKEIKKANKPKTSKNLNEAITEIESTEVVEDEEAQTDYSHLKEHQEKRKSFSVNANGKYNRVPNGKTYIKVEIADEYPSPEIQEWLDEGKRDREIRKLLGYGQ
ncbi:MAG: hypothetical protein JKY09_00340 [Crocinitomicaceae bacterium]|nr:hypothetical protein [Crocinitomicaceae bacterium]